jgi:hypothetical protein
MYFYVERKSMTDQQRIAEIRFRIREDIDRDESMYIDHCDAIFLLSQLAAKEAEIERLREAICQVRERCLKQINRGEDFCYVDAWEVLDMLPAALRTEAI